MIHATEASRRCALFSERMARDAKAEPDPALRSRMAAAAMTDAYTSAFLPARALAAKAGALSAKQLKTGAGHGLVQDWLEGCADPELADIGARIGALRACRNWCEYADDDPPRDEREILLAAQEAREDGRLLRERVLLVAGREGE